MTTPNGPPPIWWMAGIATVIGLSMFVGCDIAQPDSYEFQLANIPLLNETVDLGEEIAGGDSISVLPDQYSSLAIDITENDVQLNQSDFGQDRLAVAAQPVQTVRPALGSELTVQGEDPKRTPIVTVRELFPDLERQLNEWPTTRAAIIAAGGADPGVNLIVPLPAQDLPTTFRTFELYDEFRSVTFSEDTVGKNTIQLWVENEMPFPTTLTIDLASDRDTVTTGPDQGRSLNPVVSSTNEVPAGIPGTAPIVTEKSPLGLASKTIVNPLESVITGQVHAQANVEITTDLLDAGFILVTQVEALEVASAEAKFPAQSHTQVESVPVASSDDLILEAIDFTDTNDPNINTLVLTFNNQIATGVDLTFDMPDYSLPKTPTMTVNGVAVDPSDTSRFVKSLLKDGDYAKSVFGIGGFDIVEVFFNIGGGSLASRDNERALTGQPLDSTQIITTVDILGTSNFVVITSEDFVEVSVELRQMEIQRVRGFIPTNAPIIRDMGVTEASTKFDEVEGLEGLKVREVRFEAQLTSSTNIGPKIDVQVEAIKGGLVTATFQKTITIERGTTIGTSTSIVIDEKADNPPVGTNQSLLAILNSIPDEIRVSGNVVIDSTVEIVRGGSTMDFDFYRLTAPLDFELPLVTIDVKDGDESGFDISVDDDTRNDIIPRAKSMSIAVDIENFSPIGGTMALFVSTDSTFSQLRNTYPIERRDSLSTIPDRLPAGADPDSPLNGVFKLDTVTMTPAAVNADGVADPTSPGLSYATITVEALMPLFESEFLYLMPRVQLTPAQAARLTLTDSFNVSLWIENVKGESDSEDN